MNTKHKVSLGGGRKKANTGEEERIHQVMEEDLRRASCWAAYRKEGNSDLREEQEEVVPLAASKEEDLDYKPEEEEEPGRLTEKQVGDPPRRRNQGDSASEISSEEEEVPHPRKFSKGLGGHHPYFRKGREQLGKSVPKEKKGVENRDRFDVRRIKWESLDWLKSMIKENLDWVKAELSTHYAHELEYVGSEWERKLDGNEKDSY